MILFLLKTNKCSFLKSLNSDKELGSQKVIYKALILID